MEASELRIGNLVSHPELEISIVCIIQNNCYGVSNKKIDNTRVSYLKCQPIKLTEKWLLKFGFEKGVDNVYYIKSKQMYLKIFEKIGHVIGSVDKYSNCFKISNDIKYVHQLQNLYFALTGKELTIK